MKLDKVRFATLIGYISRITNQTFAVSEIVEIDNIIDMPIPEAAPICVDAEQLHVFMALMQEGTRKIDAIKQHRMMTGYGLKESKDIVEKYWPEARYSKQKLYDIEHNLINSDEESKIIKKFIERL